MLKIFDFTKILYLLQAIKIQESIFALPFAYMGMIIAVKDLPDLNTFLLITLAMICARTFGMSSNRLIDKDIDKLIPSKQNRHLPQGKLSSNNMIFIIIFSLLIFLFISSQINKLTLILAPFAALYIFLYSYSKRYTWISSFLLGGALSIAPSASWIAVTGSLDLEPLFLSMSIFCWASSFDIIYHVRDIEFHAKYGLYSVAKRFGIDKSLIICRILDISSIISFIILGIYSELSLVYFIGCVLGFFILFYKHYIIFINDMKNLKIGFFKFNSFFSITIFSCTVIDILL
ncbi:MAG: 4-hydroxybenzoate octaprenyltransferase [Chloroflexi bacterium]|nr:4-hydroxybenzoate octaprenyltransferase [Chloroflexota bacterium]|tara:strand:- start:3071 stop:3937 length:867 start_codon:yes stop_codon:yes gene_type:complete